MTKDVRETLNKIRERVDSGSYGRVYGAKETADERLKIVFAQIRGDAPDHLKTVTDIDSWVRRQPEWLEAVIDKSNAYADWKTAETYVKLSFAEFDVWRSEEATNRGLDRRSGG
jgi:hypothetical protein